MGEHGGNFGDVGGAVGLGSGSTDGLISGGALVLGSGCFFGRFFWQDGSLTGCQNLICISSTKLFQSVRFVMTPLNSISSNQVRDSPSI
jgi:hypothetical protein